MLVTLFFLSITGLLAFSANAFAFDGTPVNAAFFGTLGAAKSNNNDVYFRSTTTLPRGTDGNWFFENDSKLGIQVDVQPAEKLSITVQALTELNESDNYNPSIEWAYLTYSPNEELSFRLGRTVAPTLAASDYANIDFAFLPVRMPHDVYSLVPFPGVDGIDVIYDTKIGQTYLQLQALLARRDFDIYNHGLGRSSYQLRDGYNLRVTMKQGNWSASAGYFQGEMNVDAPELQELAVLLNSVANLYAGFGMLANELDENGKLAIRSFGLHYDDYHFSFSGEYVQRRWDVNMNVSNTDAFYALAGYHFGKWTPYAYYSSSKNKSDIPLESYPRSGPLAPITTTLSNLFGPIMGDSSTACIGLRYDILENLAIKTQYEKIELGASLYLKKDVQQAPKDIDVISLALSFVY